MIEITSRFEETKLGCLIAKRFGEREDEAERSRARRRGTPWFIVLTRVLIYYLRNWPRDDPGLLAADERWRVSVNVGSIHCTNYYHLRKIKPNLHELRLDDDDSAGRFVHDKRDKRRLSSQKPGSIINIFLVTKLWNYANRLEHNKRIMYE